MLARKILTEALTPWPPSFHHIEANSSVLLLRTLEDSILSLFLPLTMPICAATMSSTQLHASSAGAMSSDRLWISDSSPLFVYSPGDGFGDANAPWTPQIGVNSTIHLTPAPWTTLSGVNSTIHQTPGPSAVLLPSIYSSRFTPVWEDNPEYSVQAAINDAAQPITLGASVNADYGTNTFKLDVQCTTAPCSSPFTFQGAWIDLHTNHGLNVQIDDTDQAISYYGFAPVSNQPRGISVTSADYDQTLSATGTEGAEASVTFKGSSIAAYGVVGPSLGSFSVNVDGVDQGSWSASSTVEAHGVVLFFVSNLDSTEHVLKLRAIRGTNVGLVVDSFVAYGPQGGVGFMGSGGAGGTATSVEPGQSTGVAGDAAQGSGSPNGGVIAGAVLGSLLGLLLLIWAFRRGVFVVKAKDKKMDPWDEANMLQKQKNEAVHVTTVAKQRYVYPGLIAHSQLKK